MHPHTRAMMVCVCARARAWVGVVWVGVHVSEHLYTCRRNICTHVQNNLLALRAITGLKRKMPSSSSSNNYCQFIPRYLTHCVSRGQKFHNMQLFQEGQAPVWNCCVFNLMMESRSSL